MFGVCILGSRPFAAWLLFYQTALGKLAMDCDGLDIEYQAQRRLLWSAHGGTIVFVCFTSISAFHRGNQCDKSKKSIKSILMDLMFWYGPLVKATSTLMLVSLRMHRFGFESNAAIRIRSRHLTLCNNILQYTNVICRIGSSRFTHTGGLIA